MPHCSKILTKPPQGSGLRSSKHSTVGQVGTVALWAYTQYVQPYKISMLSYAAMNLPRVLISASYCVDKPSKSTCDSTYPRCSQNCREHIMIWKYGIVGAVFSKVANHNARCSCHTGRKIVAGESRSINRICHVKRSNFFGMWLEVVV